MCHNLIVVQAIANRYDEIELWSSQQICISAFRDKQQTEWTVTVFSCFNLFTR